MGRAVQQYAGKVYVKAAKKAQIKSILELELVQQRLFFSFSLAQPTFNIRFLIDQHSNVATSRLCQSLLPHNPRFVIRAEFQDQVRFHSAGVDTGLSARQEKCAPPLHRCTVLQHTAGQHILSHPPRLSLNVVDLDLICVSI